MDIPQDVRHIYKNKGWTSMGDFLGTGRIADQLKEYLSYREAKKIIRKLKLQSARDWVKYTKSINFPVNIPKAPLQTYSKNNTWVSYGDFLGTGRVSDNLKKYRSFKEARIFARSLKLSQRKEWVILFQKNKLPKDIPLVPHNTYKNQFVSYSDFFGITLKHSKRNFMSFKKAKKFVLKLKLKNQEDWQKYSKGGSRPDNLPGNPARIYEGKGWVSMGDFLGTGRIATQGRKYKSYKKAKKYIKKFNFKSDKEFRKFAKSKKCPSDIPMNVRRVYKNKGWVSMGDFLGTDRIAHYLKVFISYKKAKKIIRKLKLNSGSEYFKFCKKNKEIIEKANIPFSPWGIYKNKGWKGWGDFLGTGRVADQLKKEIFWKYAKTKKFVLKLKLKNQKDWMKYSKGGSKPKFIPSNPDRFYKNKGWENWYDFLGTG